MKQLSLIQGTQEWLDYRKTGVGGSDVATIMGQNPYKKREALLREKLGKETKVSSFVQARMDEGHEWEEIVRKNLQEQGYVFEPMVFELEPGLFASLDGIDLEKGKILEVKYTSVEELYNKVKAGQPPVQWWSQVQWGMLCSGMNEGLLICVHKGETAVYIAKTDIGYQKQMLQAAQWFLKDLAKERELGTSYEGVDLVPENFAQALRIIDLKREIKYFEEQIEERKAEADLLAAQLLKEFDTKEIRAGVLKIQTVERQGNVDYAKIPELKDVNLEKYRKKSSTHTKISVD